MRDFMITYISLWGISAVGSAPHWQCGGQGFESPMLHQRKATSLSWLLFFYVCYRIRTPDKLLQIFDLGETVQWTVS